jgi:hypothetical protein
MDGQPYFAGSDVEEFILKKGTILYFVEDWNRGDPIPGGFGTKDFITTVKELREKLAVKDAWKKTINDPTIRAYTVKADIRVRSGTIGPQTENGVLLPGGGHQYEILEDFRGGLWKNFLDPPTPGTKLIK